MISDQVEVRKMVLANPEGYIELAGVYRIQGFIETMLHRVPDALCVNRIEYIVLNCKGRKVLDLGCRGESANPSELHGEILKVAEIVYGVDILDLDCPNFFKMDLEKDDWVDVFKDKELDLIVASEIIEHLNNAGMFLEKVHQIGRPVIITVPNAHCQTQYSMLRAGIEYDNRTHVAKYSYHTMKNLLERHDFSLDYFAWLNWPRPYYSSHLLFVAKPKGGK